MAQIEPQDEEQQPSDIFAELFFNERFWETLNAAGDGTYNESKVPAELRDVLRTARDDYEAMFYSRYGLFLTKDGRVFALRDFSADEEIAPYTGLRVLESEHLAQYAQQPAIAARKDEHLLTYSNWQNVNDERTWVVDPTDPLGELWDPRWSENILPWIASVGVAEQEEAPFLPLEGEEPQEQPRQPNVSFVQTEYNGEKPPEDNQPLVAVALRDIRAFDELLTETPPLPVELKSPLEEEVPFVQAPPLPPLPGGGGETTGSEEEEGEKKSRKRPRESDQGEEDVKAPKRARTTPRAVTLQPTYDSVSRRWDWHGWLRVAPSLQGEGAGSGLFAGTRRLPRGTRIPIYGVPISSDIAWARADAGTGRYIISPRTDGKSNTILAVLDGNPRFGGVVLPQAGDVKESKEPAAPTVGVVGGRGLFVSSLANEPSRGNPNARISTTGPYYVLLKSVDAGDEILICFGHEYVRDYEVSESCLPG